MDEQGKRVDPELALFQKRAVKLMAHKFVFDYAMVRRRGEELEHFYEMWSYNHIREVALRRQVWRCAMDQLKGK